MRGVAEEVRSAEPQRRERAVVLPFRKAGGPCRSEAGLHLVDLVARMRGVPPLLLLHPRRCRAAVAEARQLAMYLMHVIHGRSYADVGAFFGRDRTTVSHACARIEDCRDEPGFDAEVAALEAALTRDGSPGWSGDTK